MKIFFLFLLTITLAFSNDKKIILGSYLQEINSQNTFSEVQKIIQKDKLIQNLIKINDLTVHIEKIGLYHVVSVKTLSNYVQLLRTMKAFRKYYSDLYALPPYKNEILIEDVKPKIVLKPEVVAKPTIKKVEVKPLEVTRQTEETLKEKEKIKEKVSEILTQDDLILEEELTQTDESNALFNYQIGITIIVALILLMILINTIIKLRRSSKKEKSIISEEK